MGFINAEALTAFRNDNKSVMIPTQNIIDSVPQMYPTMKSFSHEGISGERR